MLWTICTCLSKNFHITNPGYIEKITFIFNQTFVYSCVFIFFVIPSIRYPLFAYYIKVIDQAWGQDGWILANEANIQPSWPSKLGQKGFIIRGKNTKAWSVYLRDKARIPSGQDSSILPARVANHSARFGSSCLLTEPSLPEVKGQHGGKITQSPFLVEEDFITFAKWLQWMVSEEGRFLYFYWPGWPMQQLTYSGNLLEWWVVWTGNDLCSPDEFHQAYVLCAVQRSTKWTLFGEFLLEVVCECKQLMC